ncbi:MAG: hypothetical protein WC217_02860 [Candidatus Paceibacterota bacterium]|jgi:hypothetical protein
MPDLNDFMRSGEKVLGVVTAMNATLLIWATVGTAYWLYHLTPPKKLD